MDCNVDGLYVGLIENFWIFSWTRSLAFSPKLLCFENPFEFIFFKLSFEIWKFNINLEIYFNHGYYRVVPCACIQVYHKIRLNTRTLNHSARSTFEINVQTTGWFIFRFKSKFSISKLVLRFQINSNRFSWHRSFQHM